MKNTLNINDEHLKELEDEAIYVMREVAAQFEIKCYCSQEERIQSFLFILQERRSGPPGFHSA